MFLIVIGVANVKVITRKNRLIIDYPYQCYRDQRRSFIQLIVFNIVNTISHLNYLKK